MMLLGVDYGVANIGLAISEGDLAEPYRTLKTNQTSQIAEICKRLHVEKIIIGISEGKSKEQSLKFGNRLSIMLRLPVEFVDETLSSLEADSGKRKDKEKIHERAAAIILQRYLDEN